MDRSLDSNPQSPPMTSRTHPPGRSGERHLRTEPAPEMKRRASFPYTKRECLDRNTTLLCNHKAQTLYEIDDSLKIGRGRYGHVYPARPSGSSKWSMVAKYIWLDKRGAKEAWKNEMKMFDVLATAEHPHVVRCFETSLRGEIMSRQVAIMIFERLSWTNLYDHVQQNGPMSEGAAVDALLQLAKAVRHLHTVGISPRDIKGHNIAFDLSNRSVKLFDLGLALYIPPGKSSIIGGVWLGTPLYMAPEALHMRSHDTFLADMWSLGQVFFHMLTGVHMFHHAKDLEQLREWVCPDYPIDTDSYPDELRESRFMMTIFCHLLNSEPGKRWTAAQLVRHLEQGGGGEQMHITS